MATIVESADVEPDLGGEQYDGSSGMMTAFCGSSAAGERIARRHRQGDSTVFIPVVFIIAIALAATVVFGILRWQQPLGKSAAVIGGLLLVALVTYTLVVLFLAESARQGSPL